VQAVSLLVARSIRRPLDAAGKAAEAIAAGNLLCVMPRAGHDEIGGLVVRLSMMRNTLHEIAAAIRQESALITRNLRNMEQTAQSSADAAEQQSGFATSLATAIEDLSCPLTASACMRAKPMSCHRRHGSVRRTVSA
jgi:methyl-accepting chemotaxis protein